MLIRLSDKDVFEQNPELKAIPEFKACSDRDMRYIALVYDYESPMRKLPLKERCEKAALRAGFKPEIRDEGAKQRILVGKLGRDVIAQKPKRIKEAVKAYNELQYDEPMENCRAIQVQIDEYKRFLLRKNKDLDEIKVASRIMKDMKEAVELLEEMKLIYGIVDENEKDEEEGRSLSLIDRYNSGKIKEENV